MTPRQALPELEPAQAPAQAARPATPRAGTPPLGLERMCREDFSVRGVQFRRFFCCQARKRMRMISVGSTSSLVAPSWFGCFALVHARLLRHGNRPVLSRFAKRRHCDVCVWGFWRMASFLRLDSGLAVQPLMRSCFAVPQLISHQLQGPPSDAVPSSAAFWTDFSSSSGSARGLNCSKQSLKGTRVVLGSLLQRHSV